jgi:hypothetical protein
MPQTSSVKGVVWTLVVVLLALYFMFSTSEAALQRIGKTYPKISLKFCNLVSHNSVCFKYLIFMYTEIKAVIVNKDKVNVTGINKNVTPSVKLTGVIAGTEYNETINPGQTASKTAYRTDSAKVSALNTGTNDTIGTVDYVVTSSKYVTIYCGEKAPAPCRTNCTIVAPIYGTNDMICGTNNTYRIPDWLTSGTITATLDYNNPNP